MFRVAQAFASVYLNNVLYTKLSGYWAHCCYYHLIWVKLLSPIALVQLTSVKRWRWNRSARFRLTQWLKIIPLMMRSYYSCCCINEAVMVSHCVHLKLGHRFHALLKVCSDHDDIVPLRWGTKNPHIGMGLCEIRTPGYRDEKQGNCLKNISWKKRSSHQGKKEVTCIVSKPLVSCLWGCGESVNAPQLNIQEVQGALSSRSKGDPSLLSIFPDVWLLSNHTPMKQIKAIPCLPKKRNMSSHGIAS